MSSFQEALRTGSLEALRSIPKSDLHNHAFGGGNRAWISRVTGRDITPLARPLNSIAEMHAWVDRQFGSVFSGADGRLKAFEATFVQARYDGVTRLEVGQDVWAVALFDRDAARLTSKLIEIHALVAPNIEWIPQLGDVTFNCTVSNLSNWLRPFIDLGFYKSLDLSGTNSCQPIENFKPLYRMAKGRQACELKAHVGEWERCGLGVACRRGT